MKAKSRLFRVKKDSLRTFLPVFTTHPDWWCVCVCVSLPQHRIFIIKPTSFDITVSEETVPPVVVQTVISNTRSCTKYATRNLKN